MGMTGDVVIVHNGIVENYLELRDELTSEGTEFSSETDTEVIVHLIERYLAVEGNLAEAARRALSLLRGAHGVVAFYKNEPDKIVAARIGNAGGVVIGIGDGESFIASDLPAILEHTRQMIFLESHQMAVVTKDGASVWTLQGENVNPEIQSIPWDPVSAEKGEYRHFMHKEIHEQVRSLTDTISGRVDFDTGHIRFPQLKLSSDFACQINKIFITACGTAAYAGMVGKILVERLARIPVELSLGSEFRYADPIVGPNDVVLAISQSGETADTLAAMEEGRSRGATLWGIVNAIGSQAMRIADGYISMQTILLADLRGTIDGPTRYKFVQDLRRVPDLAGRCLDREDEIIAVAQALLEIDHALYLGRGINMPTAYEGALKLKELSYIHAEGYPAGEMKHGPIALIDRDMPVVVIAPNDPWYEKMFSQIEQTKARGGQVVAVATDGDELIPPVADHVIWVPKTPWMLNPVTTVIPLQLLAYHIAALRGLDVDQPRNLAKSVTVE
jgi:glucosamine--fructose-6-phosphate aminotransferase (isomerizing)